MSFIFYLFLHFSKLAYPLLTLAYLLSAGAASAQSAMFSQYYFSPMNISPAMLGSPSDLTVGLQHRTQWRNLDNPYLASMLSVVKPVATPGAPQRQRGGIGLSVVNESTGATRLYQSLGVHLGAAYNLDLDQAHTHRFSLGLQGGFTQRRLNTNQLRWGSQYDPIVGYSAEIAPSPGSLNDRVGFASFAAGIVYYYNPTRELLLRRVSGFAGLAVSNINRPFGSFNDGGAREARILKGHGGIEIPLSPSVRLLPQVLVAYRSTQRYHANVGSYVHYRLSQSPLPSEEALQLMAGAWYRWDDSWVASAGFSYRRYRLAVSYDFNTQPVAVDAFGGGAFEVSLAYRWLNRQIKFRNFSTPMI